MNIYLDAILPGGTRTEIGLYASPAVPSVGECISLQLHRGGPCPHAAVVLFRVVEVCHEAKNLMQREKWMSIPARDFESSCVTIQVIADDDAAREYLARLVTPIAEEAQAI